MNIEFVLKVYFDSKGRLFRGSFLKNMFLNIKGDRHFTKNMLKQHSKLVFIS